MTEFPTNWDKERGRHLHLVSERGSRMVAERINLQGMELKLTDLPLCTEEEAVFIEEMIPRAKEGFALALKAEGVSPMELIDLYAQTLPKSITGIWHQLKLTERQNTLPEYRHVIAAIATLLSLGRVSYFDFSQIPPEIGLNLGRVETYWYSNDLSPGMLWSLLEDLEDSIRTTLYEKQPVDINVLLKIGHFFCAGTEVSKVFVE
ncbi:MAG: hypothetical protein UW68_C0017G0013 [Candidatus Collierbacteria bacterium GW2011_GWB1_44_6]|uniref:Uncharacterized protein n=2 Tax=Candidatus Collieribacteriota TaxID=1752725 RepID=A0A0G1JP07_9BACT|nr:MAG: hypothetical protein UV68_C0002G0029 [Candidatus Collierbacteria bacterium GW2011_GWC2_43_12]KKT73078.1 MAG: hypothetical protein UW68_C0017G0013 [Candidatus Collierbacteria bacterium GW2011_GWB1_44_6]KKT83213.1 MAG: hypothetical protein UW80_C0019G0023 [Microgenomates group bacterium GW2011_GWC1_44_9]